MKPSSSCNRATADAESTPLKPLICLAAVFIFLVISSSCTRMQPGNNGPLPLARQMRQGLETRRMMVRSFVLQGEYSIVSPGGELNGDHLVRGVYPDRIRADLMGPFGRPVLTLINDGANLTVLDYGKNTLYKGRATPANLRRFLGLPLGSREIYTVLAGSFPLLPDSRDRVVPLGRPDLLMLKAVNAAGNVGQEIRFRPSDFRVLEGWVGVLSGEFKLNCFFSAFKEVASVAFPSRVKVEDSEGRRLELFSESIKLNQKISGKIFEMKPLPGLKVVNLD